MQTNDLKALTIPDGNVLSVYGKNWYPIANTFNPDNYEKETEVQTASVGVKSKNVLPGKLWTLTIKLTGGTATTAEGYWGVVYDATLGCVINIDSVSSATAFAIQCRGRGLYPRGTHILDVYVITPEQKIIGPTSFEGTVK